MASKFLRLNKVMDITGLKKSTIYRDIKLGTFPAPIPLVGRAVGWPDSVIESWKNERIEAAARKARRGPDRSAAAQHAA